MSDVHSAVNSPQYPSDSQAEGAAFTVFTATFNRAHTLPRLFESLLQQTYRNFRWLVVDDGSNDGTEALVAQFASRAPFRIEYVRQENAGKHVAFEKGVDLASGEFFLPVDSDDALTTDALEQLIDAWLAIPVGERNSFSGVTAACMTPDGKLVGAPLARPVLDCSSLDAVFKWRVTGERFGFHRIDVLRNYRFPAVTGLRFIPEGVLWFAIGRDFKTRFIERPLRIYFTEGQDRLSVAVSSVRKAGLAMYSATLLSDHFDYALQHPVAFMKAAVQFVRYRRNLRSYWVPPLRMCLAAQVLVLVLAPAGWWLCVADRVRSRLASRQSCAAVA